MWLWSISHVHRYDGIAQGEANCNLPLGMLVDVESLELGEGVIDLRWHLKLILPESWPV